jgi:hypothetical protein
MKRLDAPLPAAAPAAVAAEVYTLRVWRQPPSFRASLRAVGEEASRYFTEPQGLADYLAGRGPSADGSPAEQR